MSRVSSRTFLVFALAAVSVVLLILSSSNRLGPVEGALSSAGRPFLITFSGLGRQINNMVTTARDLATLRGRNNQLQTMVDTLTIDNLRLQEAESENERLRSLLRFRQLNPNYDFRGGQVIARVIGKTPSNYLQSITIDLGSEHGIKPGMPVVTERGLVGRIHKVGALSSTVLLITDPAAACRRSSAAIASVGSSTVAPAAAGHGTHLQDEKIALGDTVITSGLGGNFPKNLVIGQIVEVRQRDYEMFQQATIRPTVNFDRLEVVLVITNFQPLPGEPGEPDSVG